MALTVSVCSLASTVVEDSRSRFVLSDSVYNSQAQKCENGDGVQFVPEDAMFEGAMAYRVYHVALPSNAKPSVSVSKVKHVKLGKSFCKGESLSIKPLSVSKPYMRDGLWISEIVVPLLDKSGASVSLRKSFQLNVEFASSAANGVYPGKRAVERVINRKSAARFGVDMGKTRSALRRAAQSDLSDVKFLAKFNVGDRNVASFSEDGLFAVDFKTIRNALSSYGMQGELDGIKINKLCLYGSNPDTLSSVVPGSDVLAPNHLFEIPIEIRDHSPSSSVPDSTFGMGDTLVFVGYGTSIWKRFDREDPSYKNGYMDYFHSYSPYSFYQSFAFGYKTSGNGLRMSSLNAPSSTGKTGKFLRYTRAEKDLLLRDSYFGKDLEWDGSTGKEWFWSWHSRLDTTVLSNQDLSFPQTKDLLGFVSGGKAYVAVSYFPYRSIHDSNAERTNDQNSDMQMSGRTYFARMNGINFTFDVNGRTYSNKSLLPGGNFRIDNVKLNSSSNTYALTMLPNDVQYDRFDGYTVAYEWKPQADTAEWILPGGESGVIQIPVGSDSKMRIMKFKDYEPQGLLRISNGIAKDSIVKGEDVRYLLYKEGAYRTAISVEAIPQNTKGVLNDLSKINNKTEYLIITPRAFQNAAYDLAEFRSGNSTVSPFKTTVVVAEDIYRNYTGGALSPVAIRNYIAYAKGICPNLRYVLLFGYGHFDYRGFYPKFPNNYIPVFESEDAFSEDFYGILDSGEVAFYGNYDVDLAIGRVTASSEAEAKNYVQKAKEYEQVGVYDHSPWRSNLILAADDAKNSGVLDGASMPHTEIQENVVAMIDSISHAKNVRWNQKKIYLLDFIEDAAGQKKEAAQQMVDAINQGALFTSYFGHASVTDWASEGLLKNTYISKLYNKMLYTILTSFSCSASRFDDGRTVSTMHTFVVAPEAGAIASIGANRETFASHNKPFAMNFYKNVLFDSAATLGDALLKAKRANSIEFTNLRYNSEHYILIGEPVIMMPFSKGKITFDQSIDSLKALDKVKVSGRVSGLDEGVVHMTLREGHYNKKMYIGYSKNSEDDSADTLNVPFDGSLIYSEDVKIKGGEFNVEFITPRKLAFGDTSVEFQVWAYSNNEKHVARYWKDGIVLAGMSSYADSLNDTIPPSIQMQPCFKAGFAPYFSDGQSVKLQSPACLQVVVEDSTALDYREQADEGLSFEVEGWQTPFHPYPYMEQTSKRAVIRMNFSSELYPPGNYVFKVNAYDVLGNRSEKSLNIQITEDMESGLADVFNAPNPMGKKGTTFYFKNYADDVDRASVVDIFIYNQNGKLVKVIKNAVSGLTHWDGRDNHGNLLANGLYHYVVRSNVAATDEFKRKTWTKKQKLLISR